MAKLTAWLVTLVGLILVLNQVPAVVNALAMAKWSSWIIALAVLTVGIGKLVRNYKRRAA